MTERPAWEGYLAEHHDRHLSELFELLRIPSVSSLPEHRGDVRRAAEWVADALRAVGVPTVEIMETDGNPVVYGEWIVDPSKPTALIYGHYDVQPPDPLDLWETPPFEPTVRDGFVYARGSSDDKGNLFIPIKAIEALVQTQGAPPINLKFTIEGEEEIGSPNLPVFVRKHRNLLASDFVLCADGGMFSAETPSITTASKGIAACQINVTTANTDLHSGQYGASVPNAAQAAVQLAATLHTPQGKVAVAGFHDTVRELTAQEKAEFAAVPFDEEEYKADLGLAELWGEPGYTPVERNWGRPTVDINGFWGGFQGVGIKTVTPSEAHFKVTCRLVANQEPSQILDLIEQHVAKHCPKGATVTVDRFPGSARPFHIRRDHPALVAAEQALGDLYDRDPYVIRAGGTLPIAETYQSELGADLVFYSFGMPGSRVHAPNENFGIQESFVMGRRAYCSLLERLADGG
ncbi:MAG TPA: dipeptidase [Thermomicrobiales bacterium]|nr:dipeptidase [Thermomicrobiales bacterium]